MLQPSPFHVKSSSVKHFTAKTNSSDVRHSTVKNSETTSPSNDNYRDLLPVNLENDCEYK